MAEMLGFQPAGERSFSAKCRSCGQCRAEGSLRVRAVLVYWRVRTGIFFAGVPQRSTVSRPRLHLRRP